ncbi:hypothetical protein BC828DRAFT_375179 [Blastocladiella britannica]|nr:hypothetical protein BC828DRAFT_375179 [Blastocladiella britannica]
MSIASGLSILTASGASVAGLWPLANATGYSPFAANACIASSTGHPINPVCPRRWVYSSSARAALTRCQSVSCVDALAAAKKLDSTTDLGPLDAKLLAFAALEECSILNCPSQLWQASDNICVPLDTLPVGAGDGPYKLSYIPSTVAMGMSGSNARLGVCAPSLPLGLPCSANTTDAAGKPVAPLGVPSGMASTSLLGAGSIGGAKALLTSRPVALNLTSFSLMPFDTLPFPVVAPANAFDTSAVVLLIPDVLPPSTSTASSSSASSMAPNPFIGQSDIGTFGNTYALTYCTADGRTAATKAAGSACSADRECRLAPCVAGTCAVAGTKLKDNWSVSVAAKVLDDPTFAGMPSSSGGSGSSGSSSSIGDSIFPILRPVFLVFGLVVAVFGAYLREKKRRQDKESEEMAAAASAEQAEAGQAPSDDATGAPAQRQDTPTPAAPNTVIVGDQSASSSVPPPAKPTIPVLITST